MEIMVVEKARSTTERNLRISCSEKEETMQTRETEGIRV